MSTADQAEPKAEPRRPLSRDRVLRAAIELADERGIESLTMRTLAQELGVEAMSLYNHVANKEEILDGMVDTVMDEINDATARDQRRLESSNAAADPRGPRDPAPPPLGPPVCSCRERHDIPR